MDRCPEGKYFSNDLCLECPSVVLAMYLHLKDVQQERSTSTRGKAVSVTVSSRRPTSQFLCTQGYYCEEGTLTPNGSPCPAGTAGEQMGQTSSSGPGLPCARGRYCPAGTLEEVICPRGTFTPHQGAISVKDCLKCPAGFYCPEGRSDPVPCPPSSFNPLEGQDELDDCRECYAGKACTQVALKAPDVDCMQGFVCPPGSSQPNAPTNACPPGTLSDRTDLTDRSQCQQCLARYACLRDHHSSAFQGIIVHLELCSPPSTSVLLGHGAVRVDWKLKVSAGHAHRAGTVWLDLQLRQGDAALDTTVLKDEGSVECSPCLQGHYCSDETTSEEAMLSVMVCPPGFLCSQGLARDPQRSATLCPRGFFCPGGGIDPNPIPCTNGTYGESPGLRDASECAQCPKGEYCYSQEPQEQPITRPAFVLMGTIAPEGLVTPSLTPVRLDNIGTTLLVTVERHVFYVHPGIIATDRELTCLQSALRAFTVRRALLLPNLVLKEPTARVQLSVMGLSAPLVLEDSIAPVWDSQSPREAAKSASTVEKEPNGPTGGLCPVGSYCPPASSSPLPCPSGTFSNSTGLSRPEECVSCPPGALTLTSLVVMLCTTVGHARPDGSAAEPDSLSLRVSVTRDTTAPLEPPLPLLWLCCLEEFVLQATSVHEGPLTRSSTPALQGPGAALWVPKTCPPAGPALQDSTATIQDSASLQDFGTFAQLDTTVPWAQLPLSSVLMGRTSTVQVEEIHFVKLPWEGVQPCPAGHYCFDGSVEGILPCPPGTYSPQFGLSQVEQCLICPAGFYCEDWGLFEPTGPCQAGYYCIAGVNFQNPDGNFSTGVGGTCPKGKYCPEGTSLPLPCPPGSEGGLCPQAHYCPEGSASSVPCPAGAYSILTGQSVCSRCPAGYYCPEKTGNFSKSPCPPGFYCPDGTRHATQFPCPRGYYNPEPMTQSLDSCLPCPPGHYCEKERLTKVSGKCKAGWFCVSAAWNSQPFDLDNYTNANCLCPATSTGGRCQAGFYCPLGSSEPVPCPPGTFCNISGLALPMGPCFPGYFCVGGATEAKPTDGGTGSICPPGAYCVEGSGEPELCPAGTFSPVPGLTSEASCQPCTAGVYCREAGLRAPTGPCNQGYWCPPGQTVATALPCPPGHFCVQGSATPEPCPSGTYQDRDKQAACTVCGAGYYCDLRLANASFLRPCPKGHYCPAGTSMPDQHPCPSGSFNPRVHTASLTACMPCAAGHFCPSVGLSEPAGTTAPMACPEGSWSNSSGLRIQEDCKLCLGGFYCDSAGLTKPSGPCSGGYTTL
ncbi:hypothetical protein NQZ68_012253 [Dissostichus eleginoides]|nr:hypothetical protein NQZ68_012253 [Dissostichus eleginoides]